MAVKLSNANTVGKHLAASSSLTLINFWDAMKDRGQMDWTMTANTHSALIKLCTKYNLLQIIQEYTAPSSPGAKNGRCRRIGPGEALGEEYARYEFNPQRLHAEAVKPVTPQLKIAV
jgi:hypothetical protein